MCVAGVGRGERGLKHSPAIKNIHRPNLYATKSFSAHSPFSCAKNPTP